jgi:DNA-binding CsgD family transcriptional regulator
MSRRGRPPHPDILTPRQWEVLGHIREGLSDQEIAERMNVSLDGAKYHVSEILSKLGVSTREEAAAWAPERGRRPVWQRGLAFAMALAAVAALAGVVVLAFGVASTDGGESEGKYVSRQSALLIAGATIDGSAGRTEIAAAFLQHEQSTETIPTLPSGEGAWKISVNLHYGDVPGKPPCVTEAVYVPDDPRPRPVVADSEAPAGSCRSATYIGSIDEAVTTIGIFLSWRPGSPAPTVTGAAHLSPEAAAAEAGVSVSPYLPTPVPPPDANDSVWLVHVIGELPIRTAGSTGQWMTDPTLECQDGFFGMTFWPALDTLKPASGCG